MNDAWWKSAVLYQIYPRSFQDTDGDGVGDLKGVIARLPYLTELGVDALWLSPIFVSPMADFGYDIADYTAIDPLFGTMADFDALVEAAHARRLKVLLDLVPNHTSDRHPWFEESRASRSNAKRDWYIWRDPAPDGGPPNNWLSEFGGSAWAFDAASGQYYYHAFLAAQPDLNWRNPAVQMAMHDVMRFWLRRGVDGFRVDVIWHLMKDEAFRDNPPNPAYREGEPLYRRFQPIYSTDRPEVHEVIGGLRAVIDEFPARVLIGEIYLPIEKLVAYYGRDLSGAHLPFNFSLLETPWQARAVGDLIDRYEAALPPGAWPNWVLGNHDRPRVASRVGAAQARVAAVLLLTLRGTPTLYYGDELGLPQVPIRPDQVRDPFERNVPGFGLGRDGCRSPMQWDATAHAGFSRAEPWLPLSADAESLNVACERDDPDSILNLCRRLIVLRRSRPALTQGGYRPVQVPDGSLAYLREAEGDRVLVALNMSPNPVTIAVPDAVFGAKVLISSLGGREGERSGGVLTLRGDEAVVIG
ncbi:alpha-amylase family glycosyl hydrolase [Microbacteriaceae bacterium K1510]|nr:alpha-amylase family glycosyl hydrolase [Microbacteriaceae bacterium K1510]